MYLNICLYVSTFEKVNIKDTGLADIKFDSFKIHPEINAYC